MYVRASALGNRSRIDTLAVSHARNTRSECLIRYPIINNAGADARARTYAYCEVMERVKSIKSQRKYLARILSANGRERNAAIGRKHITSIAILFLSRAKNKTSALQIPRLIKIIKVLKKQVLSLLRGRSCSLA